MGTEFPQATAAHFFFLVSPCILLTLPQQTTDKERIYNKRSKEVWLNLPAPLRN